MKKQIVLLSLWILFALAARGQNEGPAGVGSFSSTSNIVWLEANDLSSQLSDGFTWPDKTTFGFDANEISGGAVPSLTTINGEQYLQFAGSDDEQLIIPDDDATTNLLDNSSEFSVIVVFNTGGTDTRALISKRQNSNSSNISWTLFYNNGFDMFGYAGSETVGGSGNVGAAGNPYIATMTVDDALSGGSLNMFVNTDAEGSSGSNVSIPDRTEDVIIGEFDAGDGKFFDGDIAEIIVYRDALNGGERLVLENHLSQKYGVTITNDFFGNDPDFNTSYDDDIRGIGTGNGTDKHTPSGFSSALQLEELNNTLNATNEFLIFAHDASTAHADGIATDLGEPEITDRWQKDYYVEASQGGTIDAQSADVKFSFDFGDAGLTRTGSSTDYVLLYRDATTGDFTRVFANNYAFENTDQVTVEIPASRLQTGYYTIGRGTQVTSRTWYVLQNGNWSDPSTWTLDAGINPIPNNPGNETPGTEDDVVIYSGKTVTIQGTTNNLEVASVDVEGQLIIGTSSGHTFKQIEGNGKIFISGSGGVSNFPDGTTNSSNGFADNNNGGTLITEGTGFTFDQDETFRNVRIELDNATDIVELGADLTLNGDLTVRNGTLQFGDGTTTGRTFTVFGDAEIENNGGSQDGRISTAVANARHDFNLYGDFLNEGDNVAFTQRTSQGLNSEATDGIVDLNLVSNTQNQVVDCNGVTNFYRIEIDKGTPGIIATIQASDASNFNLYGYANFSTGGDIAVPADNPNALGLITGTVVLGTNVTVNPLNNTGNYSVGSDARLRIDGGNAAKTGGAAITPYGTIEVSGGTLEVPSGSGITTRGTGQIIVSGGEVWLSQIRTSVLGASAVGGFTQTGGTVNVWDYSAAESPITGLSAGSASDNYSRFSLTYGGNVFVMSGGSLNVKDATDNGSGKGGLIFINSDPGNINVTGGTVNAYSTNNNRSKITSNAPFWDLNVISETNSTNADAVVSSETATAGPGGSDDRTITDPDLKVFNNLTIETSTTRDDGTNEYGGYLDLCGGANCVDLEVGRNLRIEDSAVLDLWSGNTDNIGSSKVTFNGATDAELFIGNVTTYNSNLVGFDEVDPAYQTGVGSGNDTYNTFEFPFYDLVVDKPAANVLTLAVGCTFNTPESGGFSPVVDGSGCKNIFDTRSNLLQVANDFALESGQIDIADFSVRHYGDITNKGIYGLDFDPFNAQVKTRKESTASVRTITTIDGAEFGNFRLNSGEGIVTFTSDVVIRRLLYRFGRMDIKNYNLKIDRLVFRLLGGEVVDNDFGVEDMIIMDGNASDGGVSLLIPSTKNPGMDGTDPEQGGPNFNDRVYFLPIGTGTTGSYPDSRYTPMQFRMENVTDSGYVTVNVVDGQLETAGPQPLGNDLLSKYWRIRNEGFATLPKVERIRVIASEADVTGGSLTTKMKDGGGGTWNPAFVLDDNPFTRTYENNADNGLSSSGYRYQNVNSPDPHKLIEINFWGNEWNGSAFTGNPTGGFDLKEANYTAGDKSKFVGAPEIYYSRRNSGFGGRNWDNNSSWYNSPNGTTNPPDFPTAGDIAVIRGNNGQDAINVNGTQEAAEVIFEREGTYNDIEDLQRLRFSPTDELTVGKVSGVGDLYLQRNNTSSAELNGDIGEFAANDTSLVEFYMTQNGKYNVDAADFFTKLPTLRVYGQNSNYNREVNFNFDIELKNLIVDGESVLKMAGDYTVEDRTRLGFTGGGRIEYPNGTDAYTLKTGEFVTGRGKTLADNDFRVTVDAGGGNGVEHILEVERDVALQFAGAVGGAGSCTIDLFSSLADNNVTLKLSGTGDHSFENNSSNDDIELFKIKMNKGTDQSNTFSFNDEFNISDATATFQPVEILNGTLVLNSTYNGGTGILLANGSNFLLPNTANPTASSGSGGIEVADGTVRIEGDNTGMILDGLLRVSGTGVMDLADATNNGNNFIEYGASGNAQIEVQGDGQLLVGSQVRRGLSATTGILNYSQTGANSVVQVGLESAPEADRGVFEIINSGSSFIHTGGELTIVRQNGSNNIGSLIIKPDAADIDVTGSTISIGNGNTPAGQTNIGIDATQPLNNLLVTGNNNLVARTFNNPLSLSNLTIQSSGTLDANGLDLTLNTDMANDGTFSASGNSTNGQQTVFPSGSAQSISGSGTTSFWNVEKTGSGTLTVSKNITIENRLNHLAGTLATGTFAVNLNGDMTHDGIHKSAVAGPGIVFSGNETQNLRRSSNGTGDFGTITIDNSAGVAVSQSGRDFRIDHKLILKTGVFNIGSNLLIMDDDAIFENGTGGTAKNDFSTSNMITVNTSIADKGVKKIYADTYTGNYLYPVGLNFYTPVEVIVDDITGTAGDDGFITVKPIDDVTGGIVEDDDETCADVATTDFTDADNVLQYYWLLKSQNVTDFDGAIRLTHADPLESVTDPNYSLANNYGPVRLLDNTSTWDKGYSRDLFDETNNVIEFKVNPSTNFTNFDSEGIQGSYTAGITRDNNDNPICGGAIPDKVPQYVTEATASSGLVDQNPSYASTPPGSTVPKPSESPDLVVDGDFELELTDEFWRFRRVTIKSGATLAVTGSGVNLGTVEGEGTLKLVNTSSFPSGDLGGFFPDGSCNAGGGLEYENNSGSDITVLGGGLTNVRRVILSGSDDKNMASGVDINICEDLEIQGSGTFSINDNTTLRIKGNITKDGTATFDGDFANAKLILDGSSNQTISGDFQGTGGTEAFQDLEIDNSAGVTITNSSSVEVADQLTFTDGLINTDASNTLVIDKSAMLSGFNSSRYVNGPLIRQLSATTTSDYTPFPVGNAGRYGLLELNDINLSGAEDWNVQYFNEPPANNVDITSETALSSAATSAGVDKSSSGEYWSIEVPSTSSPSSNVRLTWDSNSKVNSTISNLRMLSWDPSGAGEWNILSKVDAPSGTAVKGNITSGPLTYSKKYVTFATIDSSVTPLPVELTFFNGEAVVEGVRLSWKTASELNNSHFEIQRTVDGYTYETIGVVDGQGTTYLPTDYTYLDDSPQAGINYYRLKQIDFDGDFEYSRIVAVNVEDEKEAAGQSASLIAYPNPVSNANALNLRGESFTENGRLVVQIFDMTGKRYMQTAISADSQGRVQHTIDQLHRLPKGLYTLSVEGKRQKIRTRVTILK